jgi:hypothetical protein
MSFGAAGFRGYSDLSLLCVLASLREIFRSTVWLRCFLFGPACARLGGKIRAPMKKILVLLFCVGAVLGSVRPAEAGNVSFGIPLPFPFLFYKPGCHNCAQTNDAGYSKDNGYAKESGYSYGTAGGIPARRSCPCIPWWLQYHVEYDCNMRLGQTTAMPGVGGSRDP